MNVPDKQLMAGNAFDFLSIQHTQVYSPKDIDLISSESDDAIKIINVKHDYHGDSDLGVATQ